MEENKFSFPTEMVELPSKGLFYPETSPLSAYSDWNNTSILDPVQLLIVRLLVSIASL